VQFHFTAICAFKQGCKIAGVGETAACAERRFDETNLGAAGRADEAVFGCRAFRFTKLADFGVDKGKGGVEPVLK
jgi:hypothetical protein